MFIDIYIHLYFLLFIQLDDMKSSIELKQLNTLAECKGIDENISQVVEDLRRLKKNIEGKKRFKDLVLVHKALSDKNRLLIFEMLLEKEEMCICEFSIALGKTQPTISHHIQKLEDADLIEGIKSGKFIHYRLKKKSIKDLFYDLSINKV